MASLDNTNSTYLSTFSTACIMKTDASLCSGHPPPIISRAVLYADWPIFAHPT